MCACLMCVENRYVVGGFVCVCKCVQFLISFYRTYLYIYIDILNTICICVGMYILYIIDYNITE